MLPIVFLEKIILKMKSAKPKMYLKFLPLLKTGFRCQSIVTESYRILFIVFFSITHAIFVVIFLYKISKIASSFFLNLPLRTRAFQPPDECLLAGISICLSQISQSDCKTLWALITFHGGVCSLQLSRRTTHLITTKPEGVSV